MTEFLAHLQRYQRLIAFREQVRCCIYAFDEVLDNISSANECSPSWERQALAARQFLIDLDHECEVTLVAVYVRSVVSQSVMVMTEPTP